MNPGLGLRASVVWSRRNDATLAALLAAMVALSGCAGGSAASDAPEPSVAAPNVPADVSDSQGILDGVVIDSAFNLVEGADVGLFPINDAATVLFSARTVADGAFRFGPLDPGSYRVVASHEGFGNAAMFVQILAGETSHANLELTAVAASSPYVEIIPWVGMLRCGFAVVVYSDSCGVQEVQGESKLQRQYNISSGFETIVIETTWAYGDETMDNWIRWRENGTEDWFFLGGTVGTPVLRNIILPNQKAQPSVVATLVPKDLPGSDAKIELLVQNFYDGKLQKEANGTMPKEGCTVMGYCAGVGVALDFRFEQWVSVFMHAAPPDPSEYSALPDA